MAVNSVSTMKCQLPRHLRQGRHQKQIVSPVSLQKTTSSGFVMRRMDPPPPSISYLFPFTSCNLTEGSARTLLGTAHEEHQSDSPAAKE